MTALGLGIPFGQIWSKSFDLKRNQSEDINPWLEISKEAYLNNAAEISNIVNGKPILAVLKNNAYGIGDVEVANILDASPHVYGFALVKEKRCLALRKSGVKKPILLMGDFSSELGQEIVNADITLSVFSRESFKKITTLPRNESQKIKVQLYFDTGLGRMGIPHDTDWEWVKDLTQNDNIHVTGLFSTLTTPKDFANEQITRFKVLLKKLKTMGIVPERQHLAPSLSLLDLK